MHKPGDIIAFYISDFDPDMKSAPITLDDHVVARVYEVYPDDAIEPDYWMTVHCVSTGHEYEDVRASCIDDNLTASLAPLYN